MFDVTIDRDKYIGGSDIPAIMGISPFKKRYDLLCEKAGLTENEFSGNEYTEYGDVMEGKIRAYVNEKYGANFAPDRKFQGEDIRYHADGVDFDIESVLEIKTTSRVHQTADEYKIYLVQLLKGMDVYSFKKGILAVYERPADFSTEFDPQRLQIFEIKGEDYEILTERINAEIDRFRADLQQLRDNPLLTEEDFQPPAVVEIAKEAYALEVRMAEFKEFEKQYKAMKQALYDAMCEAGVKSWAMLNGTKVTRVDGKPASVQLVEEFDLAAFKKDHADLAKAYTKEIPKETAGRAGYVKITLPKR